MRWGKSLAVLLGAALLLWLRAGHATQDNHSVSENGQGASHIQHILVFGDSLSAEYGLPRGSGWVSLIEQRLADRDQAYQIRNASISGDTTVNGLQRLPAILAEFDADIVILQLGANDGLRGLPVREMKNNLRQMIKLSLDHGAEVLLLGQHIPPNYGQRYASSFHSAFGEVAEETGSRLVPFMLEGIATDNTMFQPDGLHPTVEAQAHIAQTVWQYLEPMLQTAPQAQAASPQHQGS